MKYWIQLGLMGLLAGFSAQAELQGFRVDQDRLWFSADKEPLSHLLENFAAAGIQVEADPELNKILSGEWNDRDIEVVLDQILTPYDYLLDWKRETGPLGTRTRLIGIRVFQTGQTGAVRPLRNRRRIETSVDGLIRFLAREILIGFGPGSSMKDLKAFLAQTGGSVISANTELGIYRILLPEGTNVIDLAARLKNEKSVALAEPNYIYDLPGLLSGGEDASGVRQWTAPEGEHPMAVAVLDSGLLPDDNLNRAVISAFDATNPDAPLTTDEVGHGTLMARLAAGLLDPYGSTVGEGVSVVAIKAFADDGSADSYTLMNAITHAIENSSGPISLSWGTETPSQFMEKAIQMAVSKGHPVFVAVGNEPTGTPMYPAAYNGAFGIGASQNEQEAPYSNYGDFVDLFAAGSAGGSQGTSIATAYVAHIAALYMQHHPSATATETFTALQEAAGDDQILSQNEIARIISP